MPDPPSDGGEFRRSEPSSDSTLNPGRSSPIGTSDEAGDDWQVHTGQDKWQLHDGGLDDNDTTIDRPNSPPASGSESEAEDNDNGNNAQPMADGSRNSNMDLNDSEQESEQEEIGSDDEELRDAPSRRSLIARYQDLLPSLDVLSPAEGFDDNSVPFQTKPNKFRLYRIYEDGKPSVIPEDVYTLAHLAQGDHISQAHAPPPSGRSGTELDNTDEESDPSSPSLTDLFGNESVGMFMTWFHKGPHLSKERAKQLVKIIQDPRFKKEEMAGLDLDHALRALDAYDAKVDLNFLTMDKWQTKSVELSVPCDGFDVPEAEAPKYTVTGIQVRNLMEVLKTMFSDPAGEFYHISGFRQYELSDDGPPKVHYGEIYTSEAFLEEQKKVTAMARHQGWIGEVVVAAIVLGSDGTKLANFGKQSIHPMYFQCGNMSKIQRTKAASLATQHVVYFKKLPDKFQDWYKRKFGKDPTAELLSFMERELYHAIITLLLNPELKEAYLHGTDFEFWDGVVRRMFPRFFIHSMDYMERIIAACIKQLSACPCPLCLVPMSGVIQLGTKRDMAIHAEFPRRDDEETRETIRQAQELIYDQGVPLTSDHVKELLGPKSLVPTVSAFSEFSQQLGECSFDFHNLIVPDFMHEMELGIWKAAFVHLLSILYAEGGGKINTLNERYRSTPTFGGDTIRRFPDNVSSMKQWAARNFEDALQCAIPAFHQLLPAPHGTRVRKLLFEFATWHALAKLRDHSEDTVIDLEASTYRLGKSLRNFINTTCKVYDTRPLPSRETGRKGPRKKPLVAPKGGPAPNKKEFTLHKTFKIHGLGHHAHFIRRIGTSDNTSAQWVEFEHKCPKGLRLRAPKTHAHLVPGIAKQQHRARVLQRIEQAKQVQSIRAHIRSGKGKTGSIPTIFGDNLPATPPEAHDHMSMDERALNKVNLFNWIDELSGDPALNHFIRRLRTYILARILGAEYDDDENQFTPEELSHLIIEDNTIYMHGTLRVNYTTYDCRRAQDYFNPNRGNADFMMLAKDDGTHRWWYGHMLKVFHVKYKHLKPGALDTRSKVMQVVWVRWYGLRKGQQGIWKTKNLPIVGFVNEKADKSPAFGFVDPAEIVRAVHLIPNQARERSTNGLGPSIARVDSEDHRDWNWFFVNIFVDRDMFMRYRGGGAGHAAVREATDSFLADRDEHDIRFHKEKRVLGLTGGAAIDLQNEDDEGEWDTPDNIHEAMREADEEDEADDNALSDDPEAGEGNSDEDEYEGEEGFNDIDLNDTGSW